MLTVIFRITSAAIAVVSLVSPALKDRIKYIDNLHKRRRLRKIEEALEWPVITCYFIGVYEALKYAIVGW